MNPYGRRAERHWEQFLPPRVAKLPDPESFIEQLGDEVQALVTEAWTTDRVAQRPVAGETFLERVARIEGMRSQAESRVLRDLVLLPAEDDPDLAPDPALTAAEVEAESWRWEAMTALLQQRLWPADFTEQDRQRLREGSSARLLDLVGPGEPDEALRNEGLL